MPDLFPEFSQCRNGHPPRPRGKLCPQCYKRKSNPSRKLEAKTRRLNRENKRAGSVLWIKWARKTMELFLQCWEYQDGYFLPKQSLPQLHTCRKMAQLMLELTTENLRYNWSKARLEPLSLELDEHLEGQNKKRWKD
ncbi:MAG: hypothetical protein K2W95_01000 [Candidatus Obscuribacterales bacterium]|nr:hypothetical protein [Candidatus Obscuribacterales bacterium]